MLSKTVGAQLPANCADFNGPFKTICKLNTNGERPYNDGDALHPVAVESMQEQIKNLHEVIGCIENDYPALPPIGTEFFGCFNSTTKKATYSFVARADSNEKTNVRRIVVKKNTCANCLEHPNSFYPYGDLTIFALKVK